MFADILSGIGTVLDTPRRLAYQGGDALARAAGYQGPEIKHFADVLGQAGMDRDSWLTQGLGFAGDVATDPLTYAGGFLGRAGAKALRGAIPEYLTSTSKLEAAAAGGNAAVDAATAGRGLGGAAKFKAPLEDTLSMRNIEYLPNGQMPLEGAVAGRPAIDGRLAGDVIRQPGHVGNADIKNILDAAKRNGASEEFVAGAGGFYDNSAKVYGTMVGEPSRSLRHERIHAIIGQAADGKGDINALPALMRWPAKLKSSSTPWVQDLGAVGDELAAQSLESRGLGNQLLGGASFLFHPEKNAAYAGRFAEAGMNPWVTGLYGSLPAAMVGAGAVGGAAAGGGMGRLAEYLAGS